MHLVLPFAGTLSPAAAQAAATLSLPRLERLLARLSPTVRDSGDEFTLSPPHERALAAAWGWPITDGLLPMAALAARADGLQPQPDGPGWMLIQPCHWHLGTEQVSLADPAELALDEATARPLFDALRPLFADDGYQLLWGAPGRWYAVHQSLSSLPTASLDRVVGRNVDRWLTSHPGLRTMRRLQAECQMLLHSHPLNQAREDAGQLPVNSVWLSGTGPTQPTPDAGVVQVDNRLRTPALADDWTAWAEAWQQLDAGPLATLLSAVDAGQPAQLTLCGERHAQRFDALPRPVLQRWFGARQVAAAPVLADL